MTIFCVENKSFGGPRRLPVLAGSALVHSSPISPRSRAQTLAVLLQFSSACWVICVWTDWERSGPDPRPAPGKDGSGEETGRGGGGPRARRSASAVGRDLPVEGFSPASTRSTPGSTREEAAWLPSGAASGSQRVDLRSPDGPRLTNHVD